MSAPTTATMERLTAEEFAALTPAWLDPIELRGAVLIARIHPCHNQPERDADLLVQAVVFVGPYPYRSPAVREQSTYPVDGHLARLTISGSQVTLPGTRGEGYRRLLVAVCRLPTIRLPRDGRPG